MCHVLGLVALLAVGEGRGEGYLMSKQELGDGPLCRWHQEGRKSVLQ